MFVCTCVFLHVKDFEAIIYELGMNVGRHVCGVGVHVCMYVGRH